MRFQRSGANTSHRGESLEIDGFGEMATHPVDHADEIGGQGGRWRVADGPVVVWLILVVALNHPTISRSAPAPDVSISLRVLHSEAEIA
jgi:hypothetical protein